MIFFAGGGGGMVGCQVAVRYEHERGGGGSGDCEV